MMATDLFKKRFSFKYPCILFISLIFTGLVFLSPNHSPKVSDQGSSIVFSDESEMELPDVKEKTFENKVIRKLNNRVMTDDDLFSKALSSSQNFTGSPKVAFLFITKGPLPLASLWERFFRDHDGKYEIYVHANQAVDVDTSILPEVFQGRYIPSKPVKWGTMDMLLAELRLIANALLNPEISHMVLLSESCIPLFNFPFVFDYITKSKLSYVTNTRCPYENHTWTEDLLPEVPKSLWRKGDEWKELTRELALHILKDKKYFPKFKAHFGCDTCHRPRVRGFVDERYIPTLLHITAPSLIANRTLTWVDWARHKHKFHPPTYGKRDVNITLLHQLRDKKVYWPYGDEKFPSQSCRVEGMENPPCYLFARKFAPDTLDILLEAAQIVMDY